MISRLLFVIGFANMLLNVQANANSCMDTTASNFNSTGPCEWHGNFTVLCYYTCEKIKASLLKISFFFHGKKFKPQHEPCTANPEFSKTTGCHNFFEN